jgi:metal-responsive CopG/Arc/MetJ family transcriptional regulator
MASPSSSRRRAKVSITVDPALLNAVDRYVQRHADTDRSMIMESALQSWYSARQQEAMIEEFSVTEPEKNERQRWQRIRRVAAERTLKRRARLR